VVEVEEDLDALLHDLVGANVVEIGDEPDATGVVLEAGIVESSPRRRLVHLDVLEPGPCGPLLGGVRASWPR